MVFERLTVELIRDDPETARRDLCHHCPACALAAYTGRKVMVTYYCKILHLHRVDDADIIRARRRLFWLHRCERLWSIAAYE
jgi:hypothetical protein